MRTKRVYAPACRGRLATDRALIDGCVALVASGGARRVAVSSIRYVERLLPAAIAAGAQRGVAVSARRHDDGRVEIVVGPARR